MRRAATNESRHWPRQWMSAWWRTTLRVEDGGSIVELAFITPIFCLMFIGAAEFSRLAYFAIEISNAAHAGAAYGAQNHATASDTADMEQAAINDAANVSGMTATATHSCVCTNGTAITCANAVTTCVSPARIYEDVIVTTTATIDPIFHYPNVPTKFTMNGNATMQVEK
jgi:Flp pilus assembly protein TadG